MTHSNRRIQFMKLQFWTVDQTLTTAMRTKMEEITIECSFSTAHTAPNIIIDRQAGLWIKLSFMATCIKFKLFVLRALNDRS